MNNTIISKIEKLLNLAGNNTEIHQAEAALQKAIELATQHNIDIAALQNKQPELEYIKDAVYMGQRLPICQTYINWILNKFFKVSVIICGNRKSGRSLHFIGAPDDVKLAKFLNEYLRTTFMVSWYSYRGKTNAQLNARDSYFYGIYKGLEEKLESAKAKVEETIPVEVKSNYALIIKTHEEKLEISRDTFFPKLGTAKKKSINNFEANAFVQGVVDGKKIKIQEGLTDSERLNLTA